MLLCADDIVHWVNHWVWTDDPREKGGCLPFDLFEQQVGLLAWLAEREARQGRGLVEKSRDTGASWVCCLYALHAWLFRPGFRCGFGSRKLEYVDQLGNMKTLFEKMRYALYSLPGWMLPAGFRREKHDCQARLVNPANGNTITGEGGDQIGRGDRTSVYFVDEAAHLEHPQLVESALSATTNVRIDVSTPNGPGNPFAQLRHSGLVPVFTLHWKSDPRKDQAYYDKFLREHGPEVTAEQLDIDYTASIEGICIPARWVRAAVGLVLREGPRPVGGLDVMEFGRDRNVFIARRGPVVRRDGVLDWGPCNTTETAFRAAEEARRQGCTLVNYDAVGVGAGITGPWQAGAEALGFTANPIQSGGTAGMDETFWPDGLTSAEKFVNLRAEMWHKLRDRFEKTFERVTGKKLWPDEECISLPDHPQLIAELSQPLRQRAQTGKLKLESKDDMRKRGVKSPNFADALCLAFACDDAEWIFGYDTSASAWADVPGDVMGGLGPPASGRRGDDTPADEPEHWLDRI